MKYYYNDEDLFYKLIEGLGLEEEGDYIKTLFLSTEGGKLDIKCTEFHPDTQQTIISDREAFGLKFKLTYCILHARVHDLSLEIEYLECLNNGYFSWFHLTDMYTADLIIKEIET